MEALSPVELDIIRSMIVKGYGSRSPFLDQLALASVENRRMTGVGIFVNLLVAKNVDHVDDMNSEVSEGYRTRLPAPCDVVGFTLFIREGCLSFLEGYTYGDVRWPKEPLEVWVILDAAQSGVEQSRKNVPFDLSRDPPEVAEIWARHAA